MVYRDMRVSEELNSVETVRHRVVRGHISGFQKNLIVWKQRHLPYYHENTLQVSEELNSVETLSPFARIWRVVIGFRRT